MQAELDRENAIQEVRRTYELEETGHQAKLALAKRRADRMLHEMAQEQQNFETITSSALALIEDNSESNKARELDDEWLFRFAEFAERVSDADIQRLWARALKSASIEGQPKLSAASLLQMSLLSKSAAKDFEKFCKVFKTFRWRYPTTQRSYSKSVFGIDLTNLEELGFLKQYSESSYGFEDFSLEMTDHVVSYVNIPMMHPSFVLTQRGVEIANAVFQEQAKNDFLLSDEEQDEFLRDLIQGIAGDFKHIVVRPNAAPFYFVVHSDAASAETIGDAKLRTLFDNNDLSSLLERTLRWVRERYSIAVHQIPS